MIAMTMTVAAMGMVAVVVILVIHAQYPHRHPVDDQAQHRHGDGLVQGNGYRCNQALDALYSHDQGEYRQQHRPGEAAQGVDLAGAKAEGRVMGVFAGVDIGESRDRQGAGMGSHMQAVCQQGHGAVDQPGDNLDHHHGRRQGDHPQGTLLAGFDLVLAERVAMGLVVGAWLVGSGAHQLH